MDTSLPDPIPNFKRRFICMVYEAFLLLAVAFCADWLFDFLTDSRGVLILRPLRQAWLFIVLGLYFIWFWHRGGQTLAMKTWRIKLVRKDGAAITWGQAVGRYLLIYMWFLPACFAIYWMGLKGWPSIAAIAVGVVVWGLAARFDQQRQFLHDRWIGTKLISIPHKIIGKKTA